MIINDCKSKIAQQLELKVKEILKLFSKIQGISS